MSESLFIQKSTKLKHDGEIVYGQMHVCLSVRPSVRPSICLSFENISPMAIKFCNDGLPNNLSVCYTTFKLSLFLDITFYTYKRLVQQLTVKVTYLLSRKD